MALFRQTEPMIVSCIFFSESAFIPSWRGTFATRINVLSALESSKRESTMIRFLGRLCIVIEVTHGTRRHVVAE
jgi:hypothetical protein